MNTQALPATFLEAKEAVQLIKNLRAETSILQSRLSDAERLAAGPVLPTIYLQVDGHVAKASGSEPCDWSIYSEKEYEFGGRTIVKVDGKLMADITIHPTNGNALSDEVQTVAAALVWSGMRAWYRRQDTTTTPAPATVEEPIGSHVHVEGWRIACDKCGDIPGIMMQSAESTREVLAGCGWTHNPDTKQDFCPKCTPATELTEEEREALADIAKFGPVKQQCTPLRHQALINKGLAAINSRGWIDLTPAGRAAIEEVEG